MIRSKPKHGVLKMRRKTNIVSIFGQIEGVIAHAMAAEGKVHLISPKHIPPTVLFNDTGERASCALVLTPETEREFDDRVRRLRA
jgi:hypothetical protein